MTARRPGVLAAALVLVVGALAGGCTKDEGSVDELCAALGKGDFDAVFNGFDPADPTQALDQLRTARVDLGELKDASPDEQQDDLQIEIDYVQALVDAVAALGGDADVTQVAAVIQHVTKAHPEVDEAALRLAAFQKQRC